MRWSLAQCDEEINLGVPQCFRQSVVRKQEISSFLTKAGRHPSHITVRVTFVTVLVILVVVVIVLRVVIISVVVVYASVRAEFFFFVRMLQRELECAVRRVTEPALLGPSRYPKLVVIFQVFRVAILVNSIRIRPEGAEGRMWGGR